MTKTNNSVAGANYCNAMESRDHSKNGENLNMEEFSDWAQIPENFHNWLMKKLDKFDVLFKDLKQIGPLNSPAHKYLFEELEIFNCLSHSIMNAYSSKNGKTPIFKQMFYPTIRRLFETYFYIIYIFDENDKIEARYESFLKHIENQYKKMLRDLTDNGYTVDGLPASIGQFDNADKFFSTHDLVSILKALKNDDESDCSFVYGAYRILCFYAHGTINKPILDEIFPTNNKFSAINTPELIYLIASQYNYLIAKFYPDISKKNGIRLG
ncbi:MAG: hypothetical protein LBN27_01325 [Prevotellaceae bacterium]|jgi:hypothetical protein|nr:hypothetical protein [Prevotellaceae bacterium]